MANSLLGVYWSVMHRRPQDYNYFKQLQPSVFKIMDGGDNDYAWARDNLPNSLIVARDWAMSEQHEDMRRDPVGTGIRHALEWNKHQQRLGFDRSKTLILGTNEAQIWNPGVPEALRLYTIALCDKATEFGLRVGAMQLSVGWPNNKGAETLPDWSPWHGVEIAIRRNHGALVCHEYWADQGPGENWGWWAGRVLKCPWQVPIVIGECGSDMYVKDGSVAKNARGWRARKTPEQYAAELADYVRRMSNDSRFVGCAVFASDFAAQEWFSFDLEPAYQAILQTPILEPTPPQPEPTPPPVVEGLELVHPLPGAVITQRFGENPSNYTQFGQAAHNGTDFGNKPERTSVCCIADGEVAYVGFDEGGYGFYCRVTHPQLHFYSFYAHLAVSASVEMGQSIRAGQTVGLLGTTGNSSGIHLHLEIRGMNPDGSYAEGQYGYTKGRVDPETVFHVLGSKL